MSKILSEHTIALVKATIPAIEAHGLDIVREMYQRMFKNPQIRNLFNQSHHDAAGSQPRALAAAILAYGANIDNVAALAPAVERIAQKHVGLQILPEHYPHVANALLEAIKQVLGAAATDEILEAWGEAYWVLANLLITREKGLYQELADMEGGWTGWRAFTVEEIIPESNVIKSYVLRPADGRSVIRHKPGQYLTFSFDIPHNPPTKRHYSISCAPNGEHYRITVKREPQGLASRWLHTAMQPGMILKVAPPAGDFFLPQSFDRPIVLLSGGVGLTPMVAMLETLAAQEKAIAVHYIHAAQNGDTHAMGDHVRKLAAGRSNISVTTFYQSPQSHDALGRDYDREGLIDDAWLTNATPTGAADYYLCGPRPFLRRYVFALASAGAPRDRIHYEFFGPTDELVAA